MNNYFLQVNKNWKHAFSLRSFNVQLLITVIILIGIAIFFPAYFDYLESRKGIVLHDRLLEAIAVHDVSWIVFICIYSGIVLSLSCNLIYPRLLLIVFQTYTMVTILRIITLYFIPLDPPAGYCQMRDSLLSNLFTTHGNLCSKDLFFSGHVSTMLSLYFPTRQKTVRRFILFFSLVIALGVIIQHVHYTIDVVAAPFATYGCYLVSKRITNSLQI